MGLINSGIEVCLIASKPEDNIPVTVIPIHWLKSRQGWKRSILSSYEAYRKALRIKADIFHFHDPDLLPWMVLLSLKGRKVIYDVHDNYQEWILNFTLPDWFKKALSKLWPKAEQFCASKFSGIISTTLSMQTLFSNVQIPKLVVSNTPYLNSLENIDVSSIEKTPFTVYSSGDHSSKRNCMQTIESLQYVKKKIPGIRLIFAGTFSPDGYERSLINRAKELGIEEHVTIEGMLPYRENFLRTASMEVGCVFYEDNVNNRLTIPNRLFEYMFAGVAVLGEAFYEVKKVINDSGCGIVIDSSEPESIAEGIINIFSDISSLRKMQSNGRAEINSKYSYEHDLKRMIAFYNSLLIK